MAEVEKVDGAEKGARKLLIESLDKLYEFGSRLLENQQTAELFVNSIKADAWDTKAKKNGFQPLVKFAFKTAGDAQRSKYAKVLQYATTEKPKGTSLKDWLSEDNGGIERRYEDAKRPRYTATEDLKMIIREEKLESGKKMIDAKELSAPFTLLKDAGKNDGYITALLRVLSSGEVQVADVFEYEKEVIENIIRGYGHAQGAKRKGLEGWKVFKLLRALEFVHAIAPVPQSSKQRYISVTVVDNDGKVECRVSALSDMHNFPWAEVTIPGKDLGLKAGAEFYFNYPTVDAIVRKALAGVEFRLKVTESGSCYVLPKDGETPDFTINSGKCSGYANMRIGQFSTDFAHQVFFDRGLADNLIASNREYQLVKSATYWEISVVTDTDPTKRLPKSILANPDIPSVIPFSIFRSNVTEDYAVPDDRFLSIADIINLSSVVSAYDLALIGGIVDLEEDCAAISLSQSKGSDTFKCVIPFVVDRTGNYATVCKQITSS